MGKIHQLAEGENERLKREVKEQEAEHGRARRDQGLDDLKKSVERVLPDPLKPNPGERRERST